MKRFLAPNGVYITVPDGRIITMGLTDEQNDLVESLFPAKGYELKITDEPSDLMAYSASAIIIVADSLSEYDMKMILDFYTDVGNSADETVFWIGEPKPKKNISKAFKYYNTFDELAENLKYLLLTAHSKSKKSKDFSKKIADCLMVLMYIRKHSYIKTQELAEKMECSTRTIQRYISTLQMAGESISYDYKKKGWYLVNGISIFAILLDLKEY